MALTEQEAAYFSELSDLFKTSKKKDRPTYLFIENVKNLLSVNGDRTSLNFSLRWTKAGTMQNGRLSTLPITFRKTEKEFSLSDILEGEVPQKVFPIEGADRENSVQNDRTQRRIPQEYASVFSRME